MRQLLSRGMRAAGESSARRKPGDKEPPRSANSEKTRAERIWDMQSLAVQKDSREEQPVALAYIKPIQYRKKS